MAYLVFIMASPISSKLIPKTSHSFWSALGQQISNDMITFLDVWH